MPVQKYTSMFMQRRVLWVTVGCRGLQRSRRAQIPNLDNVLGNKEEEEKNRGNIVFHFWIYSTSLVNFSFLNETLPVVDVQ